MPAGHANKWAGKSQQGVPEAVNDWLANPAKGGTENDYSAAYDRVSHRLAVKANIRAGVHPSVAKLLRCA